MSVWKLANPNICLDCNETEQAGVEMISEAKTDSFLCKREWRHTYRLLPLVRSGSKPFSVRRW